MVMSSKNDLELGTMMLGSIDNLLRFYWIHNHRISGDLVKNPNFSTKKETPARLKNKKEKPEQ